MEAISRTKRLLPQKRKNQKIREPLVLKGSLEIICDSSIKLRKMQVIERKENFSGSRLCVSATGFAFMDGFVLTSQPKSRGINTS